MFKIIVIEEFSIPKQSSIIANLQLLLTKQKKNIREKRRLSFPKRSTKESDEVAKEMHYRECIQETRIYFSKSNRQQAILSMQKLIIYAIKYNDYRTGGACFILAGLIEYFYKNYNSAREYLTQLVTITKNNSET